MEMSLTHTDIRGVERGRCMDADCDCDEFIVEQDDNGRVCRVMCCYCDHAPAKHSTLTSLGNLESRSLSAGSVQHQSDGVAVPQAQWNLESRSPPAVSAEYQRNSVAVPQAQCSSENVGTYQPSKEPQGSSSGQGQHDLQPSLHNEDNTSHVLCSMPADELDDHQSRMPQLLKVTLLFRKDNPPETLPNYFLREHTLAHEAELRFGLKIGEIEKLLYAKLWQLAKATGYVKAAFAEVTNEEPSYLAIDKYLKSRHTQQKLVMDACNPEMQKPLGPAIVFGEDKWVYGGSYDERILLNEECTLERALVMCLTIYYIKDLSYPLAYGQILLLLQRIVVKDSVPKACMNGKLKDFITRLEKKHII
ncbi:uncharacterized protein LOC135371434 isoform X2 [Ornithodoros turicata]|uniref:uncharacterized protein LOC135371434 isoform X2 n=1 Tax=Ornithodoros turicata TaxID=34597 RepID=UPI0031386E8B